LFHICSIWTGIVCEKDNGVLEVNLFHICSIWTGIVCEKDNEVLEVNLLISVTTLEDLYFGGEFVNSSQNDEELLIK